MEEVDKKLNEESSEITSETSEVMTDSFIQEHSDFNTLEEFFMAANLKIPKSLNNNELSDFLKEISSNEFSNFVTENTDFDSWQEMLRTAAAERIELNERKREAE